ncbi:MAG: hypothetical protein WC455_29955 [Dehalococcoidia bacterium]|jgi:hypothetical protein
MKNAERKILVRALVQAEELEDCKKLAAEYEGGLPDDDLYSWVKRIIERVHNYEATRSSTSVEPAKLPRCHHPQSARKEIWIDDKRGRVSICTQCSPIYAERTGIPPTHAETV